MVHDESVETNSEETADPVGTGEPSRASAAGRMLLIGGVAGACALGAGLGLWARPSEIERPAAAKPAAAATLTAASGPRRIPIVVDDTPAPIGKPMDVLAPSPARPAVAPPRREAPPPEIMAPTRPPAGLVRVAAPVPVGPISPSRVPTLLPPIAPPPGVTPAPAQAAARPSAEAGRTAQLAAQKAAAQKAAQRRLAEQALAQQKAAKAEKLAAARQHARDVAEQRAEAKAEAKAEKLARLKAQREKAHAIALAKAEPPPKPRHGLSALIAKLSPHHPKTEVAEREAPKPTKARLAKASPRKTPRAEPQEPLMAPHGGGPIRIANRCASADPGEALACGDPSLSAAERRLARAYRDAEDAGVPAATLALQQQRWKAARAAAAREAPWAVREVYQARIAELQDMTRDAKGD